MRRALFNQESSPDVLTEPFCAVDRSAMPSAAPLVSVVVPVYNVEKFLARCLDSLLAQTERNLEIICVNDGSTDSSASILADYAAKDARIRVLSQPNGGQAAARNAALAVATGEWVMFVDSDDWVPSFAVAGFLAVARESGARAVVSAEYAVDRISSRRSDGFRWTLQRPALAKLVGRRKIQSSLWNKFFSREVLAGRRFIEGIVFEDWPFLTEVFGDLGSFALVREPLYVYCKNADSASTIRSPFTEKKVVSYLTGIRHVAARFTGHPMRRFALRRCATAAGMLVNKVYKLAPELRRRAIEGLDAILADGLMSRRDLKLKTRWRIWRMRHG
jgi:glycosyltransferase involved in cell wall biosynthesis